MAGELTIKMTGNGDRSGNSGSRIIDSEANESRKVVELVRPVELTEVPKETKKEPEAKKELPKEEKPEKKLGHGIGFDSSGVFKTGLENVPDEAITNFGNISVFYSIPQKLGRGFAYLFHPVFRKKFGVFSDSWVVNFSPFEKISMLNVLEVARISLPRNTRLTDENLKDYFGIELKKEELESQLEKEVSREDLIRIFPDIKIIQDRLGKDKEFKVQSSSPYFQLMRYSPLGRSLLAGTLFNESYSHDYPQKESDRVSLYWKEEVKCNPNLDLPVGMASILAFANRYGIRDVKDYLELLNQNIET